MCTFDAPIERCEAMRVMVITDQTQAQCAREHACPPGTACPLCGCFSGHAWHDDPLPKAAARAATRH